MIFVRCSGTAVVLNLFGLVESLSERALFVSANASCTVPIADLKPFIIADGAHEEESRAGKKKRRNLIERQVLLNS